MPFLILICFTAIVTKFEAFSPHMTSLENFVEILPKGEVLAPHPTRAKE